MRRRQSRKELALGELGMAQLLVQLGIKGGMGGKWAGQAGGQLWGLGQGSESGTGKRLDKESSKHYAVTLSPSMGLLPAGRAWWLGTQMW